MSAPGTPLPTEAELEILRVLWRRGPSTVREVVQALGARRAMGYTTALKFLQIMLDKGLVTRDAAERSHVYTARIKEEATERRLIRDLADRAFGGSATRLVMSALGDTTADAEQLARIRDLLDDLERKGS